MPTFISGLARTRLDPDDWLQNFRNDERPYALNILNVFLYFSNPIIDAMFHSNVHSLSSAVTLYATSLAEARAQWQMFLSTVLVTYVQGEHPRPTDSGLVFARKARQVLGISENHIVHPWEALSVIVQRPLTPILFVDDFVGSGTQMIETWTRKFPMPYIRKDLSFADVISHDSVVAYLPLVATTTGDEVIRQRCPGLQVYPAHSLDSRHSAK